MKDSPEFLPPDSTIFKDRIRRINNLIESYRLSSKLFLDLVATLDEECYSHSRKVADRVIELLSNTKKQYSLDAVYIRKHLGDHLPEKFPTDLASMYLVADLYMDYLDEVNKDFKYSERERIMIFLLIEQRYLFGLRN